MRPHAEILADHVAPDAFCVSDCRLLILADELWENGHCQAADQFRAFAGRSFYFRFFVGTVRVTHTVPAQASNCSLHYLSPHDKMTSIFPMDFQAAHHALYVFAVTERADITGGPFGVPYEAPSGMGCDTWLCLGTFPNGRQAFAAVP